jgi:UDP-3-O-[3-hydroxymyristoyl] glucosamine N-acyltransferase
MAWTLKKLCEEFKVEFSGDADLVISYVCGLESLASGGLSFIIDHELKSNLPTPGGVFDKRKKQLSELNVTKDNAVIVPEGTEAISGLNLIYAEDPLQLHIKITELFYQPPRVSSKVATDASIGTGVVLGKDVTIDSNATLYDKVQVGDNSIIRANVVLMEGAKIGQNCLIYPNVTIREFCEIGDRVTIHANSVIGADGFGYYQRSGTNLKIPQVGIVEVGDDVEIGAGVMIDRARFHKTKIGRGCKLDNLIHIAHNVEVGDDSLIAAQSGIAGSTKTGDHLIMGGQSGIRDNLEIGRNVTLLARTLITSKTADDQAVAGMPSRSIDKWRRIQAIINNLDRWVDRIKKLELHNGKK